MKSDTYITKVSAQIKALLIAFVLLKLTKEISWHWAWILSPLWIGVPFTAVIAVLLKTREDKDAQP